MKKLTLLASLLAFNALAAEDLWEDDWEDKPSSPWTINGFAEVGLGSLTSDNPLVGSEPLKELRLRANVNYTSKAYEFVARFDGLSDAVTSSTDINTREFYLKTRVNDKLDIKIGRQVLTWGTGDYVFLNDLFAKDWQSFFNGRDDEYLKAPTDSIKASWYFKKGTLELVWTPDFQPDNFLNGERFSFFSPAAQSHVAPGEAFKLEQNDNSQWSTRYSFNENGKEYAVYGYKGYWNTPQGMRINGEAYFPELDALGASYRTPAGSGILHTEFSYYHSSESDHGHNPLVANDQLRFLVGYEAEAAKNLTLSGQFYVEKTQDYQEFLASHPPPDKAVDEYRQLLTTRVTYLTLQQKLRLSLFVFYSPTDEDYYGKASVNYRKDDHWAFSMGANFFGGNFQHSFFGQHEDNSNVWARVRYSY